MRGEQHRPGEVQRRAAANRPSKADHSARRKSSFQGRQRGRMESAAETLRKSSTEPNNLQPAACKSAASGPISTPAAKAERGMAEGAETQQLEDRRSAYTIRPGRSGCAPAWRRTPNSRMDLADDRRSGYRIKKSPANRNTNPAGFVEPVEASRSKNLHPAEKRKNAARAITIMPKTIR